MSTKNGCLQAVWLTPSLRSVPLYSAKYLFFHLITLKGKLYFFLFSFCKVCVLLSMKLSDIPRFILWFFPFWVLCDRSFSCEQHIIRFILKDFIDTYAFQHNYSEIYIYKSFKFIYIIFGCAGLRCYVNFSLVVVSRVYSCVAEYRALGHAGVRSCSTWPQ